MFEKKNSGKYRLRRRKKEWESRRNGEGEKRRRGEECLDRNYGHLSSRMHERICILL